MRSHLTFCLKLAKWKYLPIGETRDTHFAVAADATANRLHLGRAWGVILSRHGGGNRIESIQVARFGRLVGEIRAAQNRISLMKR